MRRVRGMAQYWGTGRLGTHQSAAYTGTAGTITNAISAGVKKVRIEVTSAAYVKVGVAPTATTSDPYFPADAAEYITVAPGEKVSAIQVSGSGTLHVTEVP
jgi:hypothetical protein